MTTEGVRSQHAVEVLYVTPSLGVQNYRWEEFEESGGRIVVESGPRYTFNLGSHLSSFPWKNAQLEINFLYTTGIVNYDGFLADPRTHRVPYRAKTAHSHFEGLVGGGYELEVLEVVRILPRVAIGTEYWYRNLDHRGPYGYTERFRTSFGGFSLDVSSELTENARLYVGMSIRQPFEIKETILIVVQNETEPYELVLRPGLNPRIGVYAGLVLASIDLMIYANTWKLGQSDRVRGFHQPKSLRQDIGMKIGYRVDLLRWGS